MFEAILVLFLGQRRPTRWAARRAGIADGATPRSDVRWLQVALLCPDSFSTRRMSSAA